MPIERSSTQPTTTRRGKRRWKLWLAIVLALLVLTPLALVYLADGFFASREGKVGGVKTERPGPRGGVLHCYELREPDANWNILFIHGSPDSAAAFREQFTRAFPQANLLAYDRPGFGKSTPVLRRPDLEFQLEALASLLPDESPSKTILVGHSYGAPIALLAALRHPERVAGVVSIGGCFDPGQEKPWWVQYALHWRATSWLLPRRIRQSNREMLLLRRDLEHLKTELPKLSVPLVMLHGRRDQLVPVENVAFLESELARLGKARLFHKQVYPDDDHFIPWENQEAVEKAMRTLIEQQSASKPALTKP